MKKNRLILLACLALALVSALALSGCSNVMMDNSHGEMNNSVNEIPSELRNTAWTKQIGPNTARLDFGTDSMTVSGTDTQYDGQCSFGSSSGKGNCGFRNNNGMDLDFQYTCTGNILNIRKCNNSSFNGEWTKL
ncbi:MAG: hypothetical protein LBH43_09610 [Treponema sp.]|jgi:uncharacterized protein YceK|nr:hypothetical protein [Treponema sp.]